MDILKLAQRADAILGIAFMVLGFVFFAKGAYLLGVVSVLSSAVSFASAKYVPARWLVKRMMLARLK